MKKNFTDIYSKLLGLFMAFFVASIIGWIYEVLVIMLENGNGFQNRGVLYGPYLPIYGLGMIIFIYSVYPLKKKYDKNKLLSFLVTFVMCMLVATIVELIGSYIISPKVWNESSLWYYSVNDGYSINFQGRIALKSSYRFGLGGAVLMFLVYPPLEAFCKKENKSFLIIGSILLAVFLVDCVFTFLF